MQQNNNLQLAIHQAILQKMPKQYIGKAKQLSQAKKSRLSHYQIYSDYQHEVSSINKINQSLQKSLDNKKNELKYLKAVRNRYIDDLHEKQMRQMHRKQQLSILRHKNLHEKSQSETKLKIAKSKASLKKKEGYQEWKKVGKMYQSQKRLIESNILQNNQNKFKQIEDEKERIKDSCLAYFQNKNKKCLKIYKTLIDDERAKAITFENQAKSLQQKLVLLKKKASHKSLRIEDLDHQIRLLKDSSADLKASTVRSMTPLDVISGRFENNPEQPTNPKSQ